MASVVSKIDVRERKKRKWTIGGDFFLCKTVISHGYESVIPDLRLIQNMFSLLPAELEGRNDVELLRRFVILQPPLLDHLKTASRYSDEELFKWLYDWHANWKDHRMSFSYEEDVTLCRYVVKAWLENKGRCIPILEWFNLNVAGRNSKLGSRKGLSLFRRYRDELAGGMERCVIDHNESWTFVQINFRWLKEKHGLCDLSLEDVLQKQKNDVVLSQPLPGLPSWYHHGSSAFDPPTVGASASSISTIVSPLTMGTSSSSDTTPAEPMLKRVRSTSFTSDEEVSVSELLRF